MIKNIIFDFDGVILESNNVKAEGFYKLFLKFSNEKANKISQYFKDHAGFSRYDIIEYFFTEIEKKEINNREIEQYAKEYSKIVKDEVLKCKFVDGFENFIISNKNFKCFIISSSDENDLNYICDKINIKSYFLKILGSPTKKAINIKNLINDYQLKKSETIYIGDSLNDYNSTIKNNITFIGRNSGLYDFNKIEDIIKIKDLTTIKKVIKDL